MLPFQTVAQAGSSAAYTTVHPKDHQFIQGSVEFEWNALDAAQSYEWVISATPTFSSTIASIPTVATAAQYNVGNGTFYWKAYAIANGSIIDSTNTAVFHSFSPSSIDSLNLWLIADSGITDVGGFAAAWDDLSDSTLMLNQSSANRRPLIVNDGLNGHRILEFDATDDQFVVPMTIDKQNYLISVVYNFHEVNRGVRLVNGSNNYIFGPFSGTHRTFNGAFTSGKPVIQDRFVTHTVRSRSDTLSNIVNNVFYGNRVGGYPPGSLTIGANPINGAIAEMVIVNGFTTAAQADSVDLYLMDKYAPPINLGSNRLICFFPDTVSAHRDYALSYLWSTGATDSAITVNASGTYTVTVTDIFDRSTVDSIVITQDAVNYQVTLPNDTTVCQGDSLTINAGSDLYSYSWSTGENTNEITVNTSGNYKVTVTNCLGNTSVDSIQFTVNLPRFSLGIDTSICFHDSLDLQSDSSFSNVSYLWSTGANTPSIKVFNSGDYILTVTDNFSCTFSDTININSDSTVFSIDLGPDTALCAGNEIGLINPIAGIDSYQWNTGATDSSIVINTAQQYILTVTENSCVNSDTVNVSLKGQAPLAGFTAMNFCFGDTVVFQDTSLDVNGVNIGQWRWEFGDGDTSIVQNPQHFYTADGSYTVNLRVVNDSGCVGVINRAVVIDPKPLANFGFGLSCAEDTTFFSDSTTINSGSISNYFWDFGDLTATDDTAIVANPFYAYQNEGSYTVRLEVTSDKGCRDTILKVVNTAPAPQPAFSAMPLFLDDTTDFTNLTTISSGSVNNYFWNFDNGTQSTDTNPKVFFGQLGKYGILLRATSAIGCVKEIIDTIEIVRRPPPVPEFNTVLPKNGQFLETTVKFVWNESDSSRSYRLQVSRDSSFNNPLVQQDVQMIEMLTVNIARGDYFWRVLALRGNTAVDTSNIAFFTSISPKDLDSLNLWLRADTGVILQSGFVSIWGDQSDSNRILSQTNTTLQPFWVDSALNGYPVVSFDNMNDHFNIPLSLNGSDYFISSVYNVFEQSTRGIRMINGSNNFIFGPFSGKHQTFYRNGAISSGFTNGKAVIKDRYVVQTAVIRQDSLQNFVNGVFYADNHSGDPPGTLRVGGSIASEAFNGGMAELLIYRGQISDRQRDSIDQYLMDKYAPPVDLGVDRRVCSFPIQFEKDLDYALNYQWSTGDTDSVTTIDSAGKYYLTITDVFDRVSHDSIFFILDTFDYQVDLPNDTAFCIGNNLELNAGRAIYNYSWSTGDTIPEIDVTQSGNYVVSVRNCLNNVSTDSIRIQVNHPQFDLGVDTTICFNTPMTLAPDTNFNVSYLWSTGSMDSAILVGQTDLFRLQVTDSIGCQFTDSIVVTIDSNLFPVDLGLDTALCVGNSLGLATSSDSIVSYLWNTASQDSMITIDTAGLYWLEVNSNRCVVRDSIQVSIKGRAPDADFSSSGLCFLDTVRFSDLTIPAPNSSIASWRWDFGDGNDGRIQNVLHQYDSARTYTVVLTVTSDSGCVDTAQRNVTIFPKPEANFGFGDRCAKNITQFTDSSTIAFGDIAAWFWNFDDPNSNSNTSGLPNPNHLYEQGGVYQVSLVTISFQTCRDTVVKNIQINPAPNPKFSFSGDCLNDVSMFTNQSTISSGTITSYFYDFGNATTSQDENPSLVYFREGSYNVRLRATSDLNCSADTVGTIFIHPEPTANFIGSDLCDGVDFSFQDSSWVTGDTIDSWRYIFNNSDTSFLQNPTFNNNVVGAYPIEQVVTTNNGCSDTLLKTVNVRPLPDARFNILNPNGAIPYNILVNNNSVGASTYRWEFGNGDTSTMEVPDYTYQDTGKYNLELFAISAFNCIDSAEAMIQVFPPSLEVILDRLFISENNGFLEVGARVVNAANNTIDQLEMTARLNNEFSFREVWNTSIFAGQSDAYTFSSSFRLSEVNKVDFVCVEITGVNGGIDANTSNNRLCEEGFNERLFTKVYPNPAVNELTVEYVLPLEGVIEMEIFDYTGRKIMEPINSNLEQGFYSQTIDVSGLGAGIYLYSFSYRGARFTDSFIVQ